MPRKRNSFATCLAAAEKRLEKAEQEQRVYQAKINALGVELPSLQETIRALRRQLGYDPPSFKVEPQVVACNPEQSLGYAKESLVGVGSIPAGTPGPPVPELTEDDTLKDDDADTASDYL